MDTKDLPSIATELLLLSSGKAAPSGAGSAAQQLPKLRRESISIPIVYLGVCTSSVVAGALETREAIASYISSAGTDIDYVEVGSIGMCTDEPIMDVQLPGKCRLVFRQVKAQDVAPILDGVLNNFLPPEQVLGQYRTPIHQNWQGVPFLDELLFFRNQHRVLLANCGVISPLSIIDYLAHGGYSSYSRAISAYTHLDLCSLIEESGLRGRGGGGFPTGKKWKQALSEPSEGKYLICNADESDPGTFMDRLLMESDPHQVLEGIAIAAYAIGAGKAYIYTRDRYSLSVERLATAINQAYEAGILGHDVLHSGVNIDIAIRKGPGAYVCGEETALISSMEGKRGMPSLKPPYPSTRGLFGRPTVVNNIETIANIPHIVTRGTEWFRSIGTEKSKGTKLFSVSGNVSNTCMVEVPLGTPISAIVDLAGGMPKGVTLKAVQMGGPSGGCATPEMLSTPIDYESLRAIGLTIGSGGINVLGSTECMLDMVKYFMQFIRRESCGKCIPCREGSRRMLEILDNITRRPVNDEGHNTLERFKGVIHLESLAEVMRDTSLCGLGQTAPNPVLCTLKHFRTEYEEHIFDRKCSAGVCKNLRVFYIDVERCTGCTACAKKCPTSAIIGTPRNPYFVVEDKCIGCGACEEACKFSAVHFK